MIPDHSERRKYPNPDNANASHHLRDKLAQLNFFDILTNRSHSQDFNGARAEYINMRVQILAALFAALIALWIPLDYLLLPEALPDRLAAMRVTLSASLVLVILYNRRRQRNLPNAKRSLLLLISLPTLFYAAVHLQFSQVAGNDQLLGYGFIPFLLVSLLSIFPLTLLESALLGLEVIAAMLLVKSWNGQLWTLIGLKELWLALLLLVIALWANQAQLHMLLRLYRQATHDPLTGLLNRGGMMERLRPLLTRHQQRRIPLAVLMMDLDRFKKINDQYGHLVGDSVLQAFARILREELRSTDIIARYGGEEFLAVLPGSNGRHAMQVAERIRRSCAAVTLTTEEDTGDHQTITFTTSIGVTQLRPDENLADMLNRVDNSLYDAKRRGRNRVVAA